MKIKKGQNKNNQDKNKINKENKIGFVYFMTNGKNIKIGYTKGPVQRRLKQLNTGSDEQLHTLGYIHGDRNVEKSLHSRFAKFRIRQNGEWFLPDDSIIDYINDNNLIQNQMVVKNEYMNDRVMTCLYV